MSSLLKSIKRTDAPQWSCVYWAGFLSELTAPLALHGLRLGKSSWHGETCPFVSPLEWLFYGGQRGSPERPRWKE